VVLLAKLNDLSAEPVGPLGDLTGRTKIWDITLEELNRSPHFGLGNELWNYDMKSRYIDSLGFAPGQAHNEFLQSLGRFGVLGVACFVSLVAVLIWRTLHEANRRVLVGSIAMLTFFGIRSVTESTMPGDFAEINVFLLLCVIGLAVGPTGSDLAHSSAPFRPSVSTRSDDASRVRGCCSARVPGVNS